MLNLLFTILLIFCCGNDAFCREIPSRQLEAPVGVSENLAAIANAPENPYWLKKPADENEMRAIIARIAEQSAISAREQIEKLPITVKEGYLNGVKVYRVTPDEILPENCDKTLLNFHGGGYILNPGEAGLMEAILMAHKGKIPVVAVDYRLAPDFPYPAALDDAVSAYEGLLKEFSPENIGIFGTSTGGGLVLALLLKGRELGLPFPGAIAAGTPWTDLSKTGDSYFSNEHVDNVLCTYDGLLGSAARVYAGEADLKNPLLSPVYGDTQGFPPSLLVSGTRDLFLSNTVRMHQKMLEANVPAELIVMEGLSHAQYLLPDVPESAFYFNSLKKFFEKNLGSKKSD